jgi:hypothetical protein
MENFKTLLSSTTLNSCTEYLKLSIKSYMSFSGGMICK